MESFASNYKSVSKRATGIKIATFLCPCLYILWGIFKGNLVQFTSLVRFVPHLATFL